MEQAKKYKEFKSISGLDVVLRIPQTIRVNELSSCYGRDIKDTVIGKPAINDDKLGIITEFVSREVAKKDIQEFNDLMWKLGVEKLLETTWSNKPKKFKDLMIKASQQL